MCVSECLLRNMKGGRTGGVFFESDGGWRRWHGGGDRRSEEGSVFGGWGSDRVLKDPLHTLRPLMYKWIANFSPFSFTIKLYFQIEKIN